MPALQRAACGSDSTNSSRLSFTTEAEQQERLMFIAELADATIRTQLLNDSMAASYLANEVPGSPLVYSASFDAKCNDARF